MTDKKKISIAVIIMILLASLIILTGCSPDLVTVPEYHYENHSRTDTVIIRDSIISEKNTVIREADSATVAELGLRLKDGERAILILKRELERMASQQRNIVHDTIVRTDSIRVPYPVEKELTWWEKQKIRWGETAAASLLVLLLTTGIMLYRKK